MPVPEITLPHDDFIRELTQSQTALRGFCQASLGCVEDAKDALQRTNVVLLKKASTWDPSTPFLKWAITVARYEVLATIRDRQRERLVFDPDLIELMSEEAGPETEHFEARRDALQGCLAKLRKEHVDILSSHYSLGCSVREIATAKDMGLSAVKVLMLRLRQTLASCIELQMAREPGV
jgi:RNA polymerase sigma-70 factor (ECF subfamily)